MKLGVAGPLCIDEIIIRRQKKEQLGGVPFYAGEALAALGVDVTVYGTWGDGDIKLQKARLVHLPAEGTIRYINEYPDQTNPDYRIQHAIMPPNTILPGDIPEEDMKKTDYLVIGPLYNDNISPKTIQELSKHTSIALAPQGMIRHLDGEKVVWRDPQPVLDATPYVTFLQLDEKELAFITGTESEQDAILKLTNIGPKTTILVTHGSNGSNIYVRGVKHKIPAFKPKEVIDPTGAGDTYLAGFLTAFGISKNVEYSGKFAAMTATMKIEGRGPFDKSANEVIKRLREER
jgi:sugar/nucleoside kinase (ribokinase family)